MVWGNNIWLPNPKLKIILGVPIGLLLLSPLVVIFIYQRDERKFRKVKDSWKEDITESLRALESKETALTIILKSLKKNESV